jgi:predicted outer membrane repeat protein
MKRLITLMLSAILFVFVASATFYVVPGGAGSQDGSSWDNAYGNIQTAIDAANALVISTGEAREVWVKAGTYSTSSAALIMKEKVNLYGGFAGTEAALSQRVKGANPWDYTNVTTLNGGNAKRCIEVVPNFTTVTVIDGFTITNGNGQGTQLTNNGGGVLLRNNLKLQNSIVTGNTATGNGGGINAVGGVVENCWIYNNTTTSATIPAAGGIYSAPASGLNTIIESCLIERNAQGGVRVQGAGSAIMNACIIRNNSSTGQGGAISAQSWGGSTVLLTTDAATAFSQVAFANPTSFKGSTSDSDRWNYLHRFVVR